MSTEGSSAAPAADNAQSVEDVKKLLAELKEGSGNADKDAPAVTETEKPAAGKAEVGLEPLPSNTQAVKVPSTSHNGSDKKYEKTDRTNGRSDRGSFRGRGRGDFKSRSTRENIKSDLTTLPESSDPVAIRKQVEFYFSDSNLPMDAFLLGKVEGNKNKPVEISILHSFKRMRHFQPFEAIVSALKDSTFLELTDNDTCIRRKNPLPESLDGGASENSVKYFEDRAMPRSVYVKGFGDEVPSTQFDIEAFFSPYGPTNAIRLRRSDTRVFKGSVFVEFADEGLQKAFLELDPKPKYKGRDLTIMSKKQYCDQKVDDIKSGKIKGNNRPYDRDRQGPGSDWKHRDSKRKRDNEDDRDWRQRRDDDRKNGFKDNKRGGHRDNRSRGGRHGQSDRVERDDRGIPVVKASDSKSEDLKAKRDTATADAIAKAKAVVEAENKKEAEAEAAGTKRPREDDDEVGPDPKKLDTKSSIEETQAGSSKAVGLEVTDGPASETIKEVEKNPIAT